MSGNKQTLIINEKPKTIRRTLDFSAAVKEANRCLLCKDAPCSQGCPAGTDPAKFIRQIKFENYKGAARTIRNNNIFGAVCSHVCPAEGLCERFCCIKAIDNPINIRGLQMFAYLYGKENNLEPLEHIGIAKNNAKVAIIGGGPAGLSCALELAKAGVTPVVFEGGNRLGGIAYLNIPHHRLTDEALAYDLKNISDLGIEVKYHTKISSANALQELLQREFKAVFVATGLTEPSTLPLLEGYTNVIDYARFLRGIKFKEEDFKLAGKNIVVVGGGGSAMDVACSAIIHGAQKVSVVALEAINELPAANEEVALAQRLGVVIEQKAMLTKVADENKVIHGVYGTKIEWVVPNNFRPTNTKIVPGTEFRLNADYVILAIGSKPGIVLTNSPATTNDFTTSVPGIFAGGDIASGGASIARAVGDGKKAANAIIEFIRGT